MRVLVTGASGFIGTALISQLLARGDDVVATCLKKPTVQRSGLTWHSADLGGGANWHALSEDIDVIYHLGWASIPASSYLDPAADANTNITGTLRLIQSLKGRKIRFVFASSGGTVYGILRGERAAESSPTKPLSAHGVSKLAIENYLDVFASSWNLDCVSARISNPFGPSQNTSRVFGAVSTAIMHAIKGETWVVFGDGTTVRDYIYVDDVVSALIAVGDSRRGPLVYNVGTGKGYSLNEVAAIVSEVFGKELSIRYEESRKFDVPYSVLDNSLISRTLNWKAKISFTDGIKMTMNSLTSNTLVRR